MPVQNHYAVLSADAKTLVGQIWAPSRKQAEMLAFDILGKDHKVYLAANCPLDIAQSVIDSALLAGDPPASKPVGRPRKSERFTCSVRLEGDVAESYRSIPNKGGFVAEAIAEKLQKDSY
jgi:hypothetical protein